MIARALLTLLLTALVAVFPVASPAAQAPPPATPTAVGTGGAAATVDPYATQVAIDVLRRGGNAVDAAGAAAAVLGVVEPYSCGIGGGGFMVIHSPKSGQITIDGRETAPAAFREDTLQPYTFNEAVTSGLSVGVPGTVAGWEEALKRYGTQELGDLLRPAARLARDGFVVDPTFTSQTDANKARFARFDSTAELFLPGGSPPPAGSVLKNPDLARTYELIAREGAKHGFYRGDIAEDIVSTVRNPPLADGASPVPRGLMSLDDLKDYRAIRRAPTRTNYRGLEVLGMGPPSSGGSTVGEALNILEAYDLGSLSRTDALHLYLEASKLAFADRGAYLGDPAFVDVPLRGLLSDAFAAERRSLISLPNVLSAPQPAGDPWDENAGKDRPASPPKKSQSREGRSTTHLTVSDRDGTVVSYTFTIESTGGSGIVVPDRGFLLNNELTDFEFVPGRANSPAPRKRPRSSMSPTIVLRDGKPAVALGSPGGATIITTVLQILVNHVDFGMPLPDAIAAPRYSQRNSASTQAEPAAISSPEGQALAARGWTFASTAEIGAATGIAWLSDGRVQAAAEPVRRGGGSGMVEQP